MYNEERKLRFINERKKEIIVTDNFFEVHFSKSEEFEERLQKDLCDFTTDDIIDFYKMKNFKSISGIQVINSHLTAYTQWCLNENLVKDNQNHYLEINTKIMKNCLNKMIRNQRIITREELLNRIALLPNAQDKFIILSLFEFGKSKNYSDISNIRISDFHNNTLELKSGRSVIVSNLLYLYAKESDVEKIYNSMTCTGTKTMTLIDEGYVVKKYPNSKSDDEFYTGRRIYHSITRALDYLELGFLTSNDISDSGRISFIKEKAKEYGIDEKDFVKKHKNVIEKQYGYTINVSAFLTKYGDYLV